jgi:hypothetical protein
MGEINVNEIIPSACHLIHSFIDNLNLDPQDFLPDNVVMAEAALIRISVLYEKFHDEIERFGPPPPRIFLNGHLWLIQVRCFGDAVNPNNCGRWFIKVSVLCIASHWLPTSTLNEV